MSIYGDSNIPLIHYKEVKEEILFIVNVCLTLNIIIFGVKKRTYTIVFASAAHGCDIFQKEIYAETGSAVILSCQISTEALTQSWRKDFLVLTRGFEMNRNLGGHERLTLIIDKWFYNLKIYNLTENDFGTYVCETQQGNSITEEVTKLIHSGINIL